MSKIIDLENHISMTSTHQVSKIIKPLEDAFGIKYFRYLKLYKNGSRLVLTNSSNALQYKYEQGNYQHMWFDGEFPQFLKKGWHYWNVNRSLDTREVEKQIEYELNQYIGIYHGVTLIQAAKDCYEIFSYDTDNPGIYSVDKSFLSHFCLYFRQEARRLIDHAENEKMILPITIDLMQTDLSNKQNQILTFLSKTKVDRYYLGESYKNIYLTKKEIDCIHGIIQGKTTDEIALQASCKITTVHRHIENIKSKLNCHKQAEIVKITLESEIFQFD